MTRQHLARTTKGVAAVYLGAIVLAFVLRAAFPSPTSAIYQTYRDVIPLIIALPAAYLAQAFQRRASYLQGLRTVWGNLVAAVAGALAYTEIPAPSKEQFGEVLRRLSASIEEIRGFYANVPTGASSKGWYPFEPVKQIHGVVRTLGFGDNASPERRTDSQEQIYDMWRRVRERFVAELDVEVPTTHHAAYAPTLEA